MSELTLLSKSSQLIGTIAPSVVAGPCMEYKYYLLYSYSEGILDISLSYKETHLTSLEKKGLGLGLGFYVEGEKFSWRVTLTPLTLTQNNGCKSLCMEFLLAYDTELWVCAGQINSIHAMAKKKQKTKKL